MTKDQKEKFDNLFIFSNDEEKIQQHENIEKIKEKERKKRIQKNNKKAKMKDKFDYETETVIGMTNRNNKQKRKSPPRKLTKKERQARKRKKTAKFVIKFIILLTLIIGGIIFTLVSPLFNISDIEIINNNQISSETIVSLSQLQKGQNIFKFNKKQIEKEIKTNAYIESVKISRKIPNKVLIEIEEREKKYNVEFLNGYAYINNQGYILEISEEKENLPVIQGISTSQEEIIEGNRLNTQDLENLEIVIQIINICKNYQLDESITSIDISNKNNYSIYIEEEKKTVSLGDETNLSNKLLYLPPMLEKTKEKEGNIYLDGNPNSNFKPRFREKV